MFGTDFYRHMAKLNELNQTSELFRYSGYERGFFLIDGGGVAATFICQPTNGVNEDILHSLESLFNKDFPADTVIQAQLAALPDLSMFVANYETIRGNRMMGNDNELSSSIASAFVEDIEDKSFSDMTNGARIRNYEFWFTIRFKTRSLVPLDAEFVDFEGVVRDVAAALQSAYLSPYRAEPLDMLRRLQCIFNPERSSRWRNYATHGNTGFNEAIVNLGKGVFFTPDSVVCAEPFIKQDPAELAKPQFDGNNQNHIRVMSLQNLPERIVYGMMLDMVGDWQNGTYAHSDPFIVSSIFHYPEQSSAKSKVSNARQWLINQAKGKMLEWFQNLALQKRDYDALWNELDEERCSVVHGGVHIITMSDSRERSDNTISSMMRYLDKKRIGFAPETALTAPLLMQNLPGLADETYANFKRHNVYSSKVCPFLTPHIASWKGTAVYPVVPLVTRLGQIFNLDIFKTDGGFNFMLCAKTGSGKSVLVNYIVGCYLNSGMEPGGSLLRKAHQTDYNLKEFDDGARVFLLDSGGSYKNMCDMYQDSQYLRFNGSFKYSLNPFPSIVQWSSIEENGEDLGQGPMVLTMLKAMAAPQDGVTELQRAEMQTLLTELWNKEGRKATITKYVDMCLDHPEEYMQHIGKQLKPFSDYGDYGALFSDNRPAVDFNGRLIVIELEDLASDIHLQMVVILALINQIQSRIFLNNSGRRTLFLLEEAWQWLTVDSSSKRALTEFVGDFLQASFRKFRKVNAAGGVISQSYSDYLVNNVGQAIVANTDWKFFLGQDSSQVEKLRNTKAFAASDGQFDLMKSVHTKKGAYSEIMMFHGGVSEIGRLELKPETLMIFSTDPVDRQLMQKYRAQGFDVQESARMATTEKAQLRL